MSYTYGQKVAIATDQWLHSILVGGDPDETFSARCYRWHLEGDRSWPMHLVDLLFFWQDAHCKESFINEVLRKQLPSIYRTGVYDGYLGKENLYDE